MKRRSAHGTSNFEAQSLIGVPVTGSSGMLGVVRGSNIDDLLLYHGVCRAFGVSLLSAIKMSKNRCKNLAFLRRGSLSTRLYAKGQDFLILLLNAL